MKKTIALLMVLCVLMCLAACGGAEGDGAADGPAPLELLQTIWDSYPESERFAAVGGDAENMVDGGPGAYAVEDAAALDAVFGVPEASAAGIAQAASLMHMMNANTFTCGAFRLAQGTEPDSFAAALREGVTNRRWLCGFPDTLLLLAVGDTVLSVFGADELVQQFKTRALDCYPAAELLAEEPLAF